MKSRKLFFAPGQPAVVDGSSRHCRSPAPVGVGHDPYLPGVVRQGPTLEYTPIPHRERGQVPRTLPNHPPGWKSGPAKRFATFSTTTKRVEPRQQGGRFLPIVRYAFRPRASFVSRNGQGSGRGTPEMTSTPIPSAARRPAVRVLNHRNTGPWCFASTRRQNGSIFAEGDCLKPARRSRPTRTRQSPGEQV